MTDSPFISVIMPAYNCEKYIKAAIDSVLNQTYGNFELLIADDCSSDKTKEIINAYNDKRIHTFHNKINLGYLKASNELFKKCKGDFITFQDADDYSDVSRFERMINFFDLNPEIDCLGSNIIKIDSEGAPFYTSDYPNTDGKLREMFANYKIVFTGSALMIKKCVIEKLGIYNEYFDRIGSEDTYLYSHILDHYKVASLPDSLYYYRANPNSVTANHKNPKALVGSDLIIRLYKNRKLNKPDYIYSGEWKSADAYVKYLLAIRKITESLPAAIKMFIVASLKSPKFMPVFIKEFMAKVKFKLFN